MKDAKQIESTLSVLAGAMEGANIPIVIGHNCRSFENNYNRDSIEIPAVDFTNRMNRQLAEYLVVHEGCHNSFTDKWVVKHEVEHIKLDILCKLFWAIENPRVEESGQQKWKGVRSILDKGTEIAIRKGLIPTEPNPGDPLEELEMFVTSFIFVNLCKRKSMLPILVSSRNALSATLGKELSKLEKMLTSRLVSSRSSLCLANKILNWIKNLDSSLIQQSKPRQESCDSGQSGAQQGSSGDSGQSGAQQGSSGDSGQSGTQQGSSGDSGQSGAQQGSSGDSGQIGAQQGSSGDSGQSGAQQGSSGDSGQSGAQQGSSGDSGQSGAQQGSGTDSGQSSAQQGSSGDSGQSVAQQGSSSDSGQSGGQLGSIGDVGQNAGCSGQDIGQSLRSMQSAITNTEKGRWQQDKSLSSSVYEALNNESDNKYVMDVATMGTTDTQTLSHKRLQSELNQVGKLLSAKVFRPLEKQLKAKNWVKKSFSNRGGDIEPNRLYRATTDGKCFKQETIGKAPNTVVLSLIDGSRSMAEKDCNGFVGERGELAQATVFGLNTALKRLGIVCSSYLFIRLDEQDRCNTLVPLLRFGEKPISMLNRMGVRMSGGTPTGEALMGAIAKIKHRSEERKVIYVLTDGEAQCQGTLEKVDTLAENFGIEVYYICIAMRWKYDFALERVVEIENPGDMPKAIRKLALSTL